MEAWRQCAQWLVAARVLPGGHRASSTTGQVWDLAQALRDGVLLCHLLNALLPQAVPPRDICPRPQMSQVRPRWGNYDDDGDNGVDGDDDGWRTWGNGGGTSGQCC
uniref:CASAMP second calponin-homology domain-containing protein n=1 Tax=Strigops habroptila TaxID=2489341 RepID=A0A672U0H6_STRHB